MIGFYVSVCLIIITIACTIAAIRYDHLLEYEPISNEELLLLTLVDEEFYTQLLEYVRTMNMSLDLQNYLRDKKDVLESISYYMLTRVAQSEQEKKERWEKDRANPKAVSSLSHNEKMILQRIKRWL